MEVRKNNATIDINENALADAVDVAAGKKHGGVISGAASELVRRSPDESFASLDDMLEACYASRKLSRQATVNLAELTVSPENSLSLSLPNGNNAKLTHYSLGQLVKRIGYNSLDLINRLPGQLASDVINHGLKHVAIGSVADTEVTPWESDSLGGRPVNANTKLLWRENGEITLDSITNASYGRFFDAESAEFAKKIQEQNQLVSLPVEGIIKSGIKGSFFKGDRDSFICLRDNSRRVFEKDESGGLSRMVMISNSEVESRPWSMVGGYYSYLCTNWNFWNATQAFDVTLRHSKNFRDNFKPDDLASVVKSFFDASPAEEETFIGKAQAKTLGADDDECVKALLDLHSPVLGKKASSAIVEMAQLGRYGDPRSVWSIANCITERAQQAPYTNVRVAWQDAAREVFDLAA